MRLLTAAVCFACFVSCSPIMAQKNGDEGILVVNGGFEQRMTNWEGPSGPGRSIADEKHSGDHSLALRDGYVFQPPGRKQLIWIDPDHDLHISLWIKCTDCGTDGVTVMANAWHGPDREHLRGSGWLAGIDLSLRRYAGAEIVEDRLASDNAAIRMPGNKPDWGIQMRLDNLPPDKVYRLCVTVRVDPGDGSANDVAMRFGVHPGTPCKVVFREVSDGRYHTFTIPGTWTSDAGANLWFSPPNSSTVRNIYVDRVVAVQVSEEDT